jgi:hypothetical protein
MRKKLMTNSDINGIVATRIRKIILGEIMAYPNLSHCVWYPDLFHFVLVVIGISPFIFVQMDRVGSD